MGESVGCVILRERAVEIHPAAVSRGIPSDSVGHLEPALAVDEPEDDDLPEVRILEP